MTTERRENRALLKVFVVLGVLAALLLWASVNSPPAGHAAFPGANGKIAFTSYRDGNAEIYVMNPDSTGQTNVTNDPASDQGAAWSPSGTKIAFYRNSAHPLCCNIDIYVMNADGSGQTNLTNNPAPDGSPAWSPDGTKIAFDSWRDGNRDIYVMNADGSGQTRLTNDPAQDSRPDWSPDGTKIAFYSYRDFNFEVYVMNADGSGQTRLTNNPATDFLPAWSPDGTKIAFSSFRDGNFEIYVMNADGTGQTRLTNNPAADETPAWQPLSTADADGDGIPDADDACPGTTAGATVDGSGCSDAQVDVDGDGICNPGAASGGPSGCTGSDACPSEAPAGGLDADEDGCTDTIDGLIAIVESMTLQPKIEGGLLRKLNGAQKGLDRGNTRLALNKLGDFIRQVEAQRGKALTDPQADLLANYANNIILLI
jgi:TolB protein